MKATRLGKIADPRYTKILWVIISLLALVLAGGAPTAPGGPGGGG